MTDPLLLNENILADVESKTGLRFRRIDGIDTRDKTIAQAVLPVLKEWTPLVSGVSNTRLGIFGRFITPHAVGHIDWLLRQWETEADALCEGALITAITLLAKPGDATKVWDLCRRHISQGRLNAHYFHLLSKLAKFPSISRDVKDKVVELIQYKTADTVNVAEVAKIDDPRILKWLEKQNSSDPYVRAVLKRVAARGNKLPPGIALAATIPDPREEIFSTEDDLSQIGAVLGGLAKQIGVKIPSVVRKGSFLSSVEPNRWLQAPISSNDGRRLTLWFRLEDVDVVQIVVTEPKDRPSPPN